MTQKQNTLTKTGIVALLACVCCILWGSAIPVIKTGYRLIDTAQAYCEGQRVMVCSDFESVGNGMICCSYGYDRILCNSLEEYKNLTQEQIEMEAYQAWMTGAH